MRRFKLLGVAIVALLAFATALASSASAAALPQNLPELTTERAFTGEAGKATLETVKGLKIECESAKAEGKEESKKPLGSVHIHFLNCVGTINKVATKCNSLGDTTGQILILIKWHLVYDVLSPELKTELLYLISGVHLECASATVLLSIEGSLGCLHQNPTVKSKTHETKCEQEKGKPKDKLYFNEKEEMTSSLLLTAVNGGTAEESGEAATSTQTTTEETVADQ